MVLVLNIIVGMCVIYFIRWYLKRRTVIKKLEKFDGPTPLPLIGNAQELVGAKLLSYMCDLGKYGTVAKLWVGPTPTMLVIQDYKFIEFLMNDKRTRNKCNEYKYIKNWIGEGILSNDGGPRWAKHRKMANPAFYLNVLETFIPLFTSVCNKLLKKFEKEIGNPSFEISHVMKLYTLDNICECAMGTPINALESSKCDFVEYVNTVCELLVLRTFNLILQPDFLFKFSKHYERSRLSFKGLNDKVELVIRQRKTQIKNEKNITNAEESEYGKKTRSAFLDLLLKEAATDPFLTGDHIKEEVATFMFAGHDTVQAALSFCIFSLAAHQDIQENVVKELHEIFYDDKKRNIVLSDINNMKYTEAVIKETLRLYPPVPFYARRASEEFEYDGAVIPKGMTLIMNPFGLHRRPDLYENPLKFDPQRFLTGAEPKHKYAYIPFSGGARDCMGRKFAMIEMKLTLAMLLREFIFLPTTPEHQLELETEVNLVSKSGVRIQLTRRKF